MSLADIPAELKSLPQWVAWRNVMRNGKASKVPVNPATGKAAKTNDPSTWGSYDEAMAYMDTGKADGIGFVFSDDKAYTGVDLDHVLNPNGTVKDAYKGVLEAADTYVERSPSGEGVHIIYRGGKPGEASRKGPVEMYDHARFFTFTGDVISGAGKLSDGGEAIEDIYSTWLDPNGRTQPSALLDRKDAALKANAELAKKTLRAVFDGSGGDMRAVIDAYPELVRMFGRNAARVAVDYYGAVSEIQEADAGYEPQTFEPYTREQLSEEARLGVFGKGGAKMSGGSLAGDANRAYRFLESRLGSRLYGYSDYTAWQNSMRDPRKPRWAFVPHAGACGWCVMIGSRGFNYLSKDTAMATRHEHCLCSVAVDFSDDPRLKDYDPETMYDAYEQCRVAVEDDARRAWKEMSKEERDKYERGYDGYLRNRIVGEMNTRDRGWLHSKKAVPVDDSAFDVSKLNDSQLRSYRKERRAAGVLSDNGYAVIMTDNPLAKQKRGVPSFDYAIGERNQIWEAKCPEGDGYLAVAGNIAKADAKFRKVGEKSKIVISNLDSDMDDDVFFSFFKESLRDPQSDYSNISDVLLVMKGGYVRHYRP